MCAELSFKLSRQPAPPFLQPLEPICGKIKTISFIAFSLTDLSIAVRIKCKINWVHYHGFLEGLEVEFVECTTNLFGV